MGRGTFRAADDLKALEHAALSGPATVSVQDVVAARNDL
jgi:hypothetical protein